MRSILYVFLIIFFVPSFVLAEYVVPTAPAGYILDQANVLSPETQSSIQSQLATLDADTSTQVVVVTLTELQGYPIETVGLEIGREWGVGQEGNNNGMVIIIAPNDKQVRIEVGYGLEGVMTDAESSWIIRNLMIPSMREGDYDTAVLFALERIIPLVRQEEFPRTSRGITGEAIFMILWFVVIFCGIIFSILRGSKSWWAGGVIGGIAGAFMMWWAGIVIGLVVGLAIDYILSTYFYQKMGIVDKKGRYTGWGGGGSGGGGFGGFGGGGFGGGGASGRW